MGNGGGLIGQSNCAIRLGNRTEVLGNALGNRLGTARKGLGNTLGNGLGNHGRQLRIPIGQSIAQCAIRIAQWVGQWIALISIDVSLFWCFLSFVLFRVFDILKPYPINKIESYGGGLGIMADDVAAGFYTLLVLHILQFFIK